MAKVKMVTKILSIVDGAIDQQWLGSKSLTQLRNKFPSGDLREYTYKENFPGHYISAKPHYSAQIACEITTN